MVIRAREIESAALQLPRRERANLATRLIASLNGDTEGADVEAAWQAEIERRVREVDFR